MPNPVSIAPHMIDEYIRLAVPEVFNTMLSLRADPTTAAKDLAPVPGVSYISGTVGFVGEANGVVYLFFTEAFARHCSGMLLGLNPREVAELGHDAINDAIGELTNMTVGAFKTRLCDARFPCKLTIPSILRGRDFTIEPIAHVRRFQYGFTILNEVVTVEILLRDED